MARITLKALRHSYVDEPRTDDDWALKRMDVEWADGGAYALLGPSGCGKTTLLNIMSCCSCQVRDGCCSTIGTSARSTL